MSRSRSVRSSSGLVTDGWDVVTAHRLVRARIRYIVRSEHRTALRPEGSRRPPPVSGEPRVEDAFAFGRWDLLAPGNHPVTTVEGRPRHAQRPARRRHADRNASESPPSQSFPSLRVNPSSPDIFDCTSRTSSFSSRRPASSSHLGTEGVVLWFYTARSPQAEPMPGLAPTQMRGVQPLTAKNGVRPARSCTSVRLLGAIRGSELGASAWPRFGLARRDPHVPDGLHLHARSRHVGREGSSPEVVARN